MTRGLRIIAAAAALAAVGWAGPVAARSTFWDLRLGMSVAEMPGDFIQLACGTNGGPPGRPLRRLDEWTFCLRPGDSRAEVYLRYDDEAEYVARANRQTSLLARVTGTQVFGFPVILSVIIDNGFVVGLRFSTDPRGAAPGPRSDHWALARMMMLHHGEAGWTCLDAAGPGETPVSNFLLHEICTKEIPGATLTVTRRYLHRPGQHFMDEFEKVQPTHFVSTTDFEMLATPPEP